MPTNREIAELLSIEADTAEGHVRRAFKRAARRAFTWAEEATDLVADGRSPTELPGIGPFLSERLERWIEDDVVPPDQPPLRQNFLTLTHARRVLETRPTRPLGDLQMHTTYSDGGSTLDAMASAAAELGYSYIAITDHSAGLRIVKGLDEEGLARQGVEIDRVNTVLADSGQQLRVLRSVEMNLNPRGEGDVDPRALAKLDLVLGSFHSSLRRTDDQTDRYIAAIENPHVHVLGHPRGRIYNFRAGLTADWARVFDAAARTDKAVEIDAYPDRQDLDVELLKIARDSGVRISIGTDAHAHWQLEWIDLGVAAAIEAGIDQDRILNLMPLEELLSWTAALRERATVSGSAG